MIHMSVCVQYGNICNLHPTTVLCMQCDLMDNSYSTVLAKLC